MTTTLTHADYNQDDQLLPSQFFSDSDINQEAALLELLGVEHPNKRIIRLRFENRHPELHFGNGAMTTLESASIPWAEPEHNPEATARLLKLADAFPELAPLIEEYLFEPCDTAINTIVRHARHLGISEAEPDTCKQPERVSLISSTYAYIRENGPVTREVIISDLASTHTSRRPAAAVRTSLRRLVRLGQVILADGFYHAVPGSATSEHLGPV